MNQETERASLLTTHTITPAPSSAARQADNAF
jgi:hypothetical protein